MDARLNKCWVLAASNSNLVVFVVAPAATPSVFASALNLALLSLCSIYDRTKYIYWYGNWLSLKPSSDWQCLTHGNVTLTDWRRCLLTACDICQKSDTTRASSETKVMTKTLSCVIYLTFTAGVEFWSVFKYRAALVNIHSDCRTKWTRVELRNI